jgi:uncharacterized protein YacL
MSTLINLILALVLNITGVQVAQKQQEKVMALENTIELCDQATYCIKNEPFSKKNQTNEY